MSFDLFVGCFENGELASFPTEVVINAFAAHTLAIDPDGLRLAYDDSGMACTYVYLDTSAPRTSHFSVNRPVDDPALYQALLAILREGHLALYMAGDCPPLLGRAETARHLPADMIEALGEPVLLKEANEIFARIATA
ncbi:hypothetical protein [Pseudomonas mangrovi]|uniref:Uncharacterized protein n=1 Tax=Pseudomonas mangrovi TaxID=2161748 RepID=A0A2T5PBP7_9PSED|nr:hypothetical protein [Pseudomonas mangrovi]PTU75170.1 hypothetical protein DBO85_06355 [Pseudomonas mangrovi]